MPKLRVLIAAFLAFWLVLGPAGGAWASGGGASCESMMSTLPADDCCGGDNAAVTSCAGVCTAASLGIRLTPPALARIDRTGAPLASLFTRYASRAAPPDVAPPKILVS